MLNNTYIMYFCRLDKDQFLRRTVNEFIKSDDDEKFDQDYYEFEGMNYDHSIQNFYNIVNIAQNVSNIHIILECYQE